MEKKVILKRKFKTISIILFIIIVFLVYLAIKLFLNIKIQNIYVLNNHYLSDDYILEKSGLIEYPSYFKNISFLLEDKLEKDAFIKKANVTKNFFGVINIDVTENNIIFYKESDGKYVLEDGKEVSSIPYDISTIRIVNYIPDTVYDNFIKKILKLNEEVKNKISEIKYDPSEYDNSRFMIYMVDGNYVYVTLTKFESLNYYNEIYPTLEGKKGILYLDSGNHFVEIK
jgi:cell division protein FtsQ